MPTPSLPPREVRIPTGDDHLLGDLVRPPGSSALVLFAHGSGSGRHSARNRRVAARLHESGVGTLLFDLLTASEQDIDLHTRQHRFDIALLTRRLQEATDWALHSLEAPAPVLGYFGASTGSAAALVAAARLGDRIGAVVSRGGRPDLAGAAALEAVTAPTLLIVGEADPEVMELNSAALERMRCHRSLALVPHAGHLFEEPGTLEIAADHAAAWFSRHLAWAEQHA
ncbi:dienelactone hydrolase family protein [Ramlibacter sp. Leaf400]|uniref:dienelactone hydrolase family protein n=1 Tax=Ramlibacter sp. Leaf400 TaxID=1736365 RepID=UPI0007000B52|nr:alpha/beta family hydrolase [Ramlibacter sp. Leaf400]KQT13497.1 hydrolase [Ramlibacter sp. Leaf400]